VDVASLENERALSHAAWLAALATVVGYPRLGDLAGRAVGPLVAARAATLVRAGALTAVDDARSSVHALQAFCTDDRGLRMRLGGLGAVAAAELAARGVDGPVARASGLDVDARAGVRRYVAIGFRLLVEDGGDALARTRLRAREAAAALGLASALLAQDDSVTVTGNGSDAPAGGFGVPVSVEGPRGPLRVTARPHGAPAVAAPGHGALLELAGRAMEGLEHASALAVLVSFDLSPWRVGP